MGIIEEATKRLEQLEQAGVAVPWTAARAVRDGAVAGLSAVHAASKGGLVSVQPPVGASSEAGPASERPAPSINLTIDLDRLGGEGYIVPARVRSQLAAEFREVKRTLLKNARAKGEASTVRGTLVAVTSAVPGEGKTFCAINLAMSMAMEVDTAVLLIDADVVRPNVLTRLGLAGHPPGLLDLLVRDGLPLHEALISTNVPKLTVMASGSRNERSPELLGSKAMNRLLDRLATEYADHIVIFDAPPLLLASEASTLASSVGQVVMVVEASRTPRHLVSKAFAALRNCPVVLSVLNKDVEPEEEQRYGHYYG